MEDTAPLWRPSRQRIAEAALSDFAEAAGRIAGRDLSGYDALHAWSIEDREAFWSLIWEYCEVIGERGARVLENADAMPGASFFPDARLNFAENLLRNTGDGDALVFRGEDKVSRRVSFNELRAMVSRLQQALEEAGVKAGDRVAAMMPNMPETVAAMLAATSIGAIWSSCSPDFGPQGVLDRFGQIEPVVFVTVDGYWYAGKANDVGDKVAEVVGKLPSLRKVLVVDYLGKGAALADRIAIAEPFEAAMARFEADEPRFLRLPFDHPLYIL